MVYFPPKNLVYFPKYSCSVRSFKTFDCLTTAILSAYICDRKIIIQKAKSKSSLKSFHDNVPVTTKNSGINLKIKAVTNTPVPVTINVNLKVPVDLKLQLRIKTSTLIFLNISGVSNHSFFMWRIEEKKQYLNFFPNLI